MTNAHIILAVAAEANDEFVWSQLETLQAQMFAAGPVDIKLAYYGAEGPRQRARPYIATRWISDPAAMADLIENAREQCICGCFVPIANILDHAAREKSVQAVVIIGDQFHGDPKTVAAKARQLADAGTRVFMLQQGIGEPDSAFQRIAEASGGAFLQFNPHVERIARRLPRVVEAITHFALGGLPALQAQDGEASALLIEQMTTAKLGTIRRD